MNNAALPTPAVTPEYAERVARQVDWTKAKALWGAVATALVGGLIALWMALDDGGVSAREWVQIALAVLGAPSAVGVTVARVSNRAKRRTP